jgi:hypothetical protein
VITYSKTAVNPDNNIFHGFVDAAFANHDDHKSTSGYVFLAAGGAITWKSKKQTTIALFTTQAEYVALYEAVHEACSSAKVHPSGTVWHVWQVSCQKSSSLHFLSEFLRSHNAIITIRIYILVRPSISVPKAEALNK